MQKNNTAGEGSDTYFTLSFDYTFQQAGEVVWFAHAVPFTYTDMQQTVQQHLPAAQEFMRAEILCNSLCGLPLPVLTITENIKTYLTYPEQLKLQFGLPVVQRKSYKRMYAQGRKLFTEDTKDKQTN